MDRKTRFAGIHFQKLSKATESRKKYVVSREIYIYERNKFWSNFMIYINNENSY